TPAHQHLPAGAAVGLPVRVTSRAGFPFEDPRRDPVVEAGGRLAVTVVRQVDTDDVIGALGGQALPLGSVDDMVGRGDQTRQRPGACGVAQAAKGLYVQDTDTPLANALRGRGGKTCRRRRAASSGAGSRLSQLECWRRLIR